jgi:hypothetical protein
MASLGRGGLNLFNRLLAYCLIDYALGQCVDVHASIVRCPLFRRNGLWISNLTTTVR